MVGSIDWQARPESIAIEMHFDGPQPNHFGAIRATAQPMRAGDFVGDTRQGGSCNAQNITLNPHCNGTHTESLSHVIDALLPPHQVLSNPLMQAQLITLKPQPWSVLASDSNSYQPSPEKQDMLLCKEMLTNALKSLHINTKALIIRTLPNSKNKLTCAYGVDVKPAFFTHEAMHWLVTETQIDHLLVDLPSVDRLDDGGLLSNHRIFWNIKPGEHQHNKQQWSHKTITEMVYIPNHLKDGTYGLNLQLPRLKLDAVPSNPLLYPLVT